MVNNVGNGKICKSIMHITKSPMSKP